MADSQREFILDNEDIVDLIHVPSTIYRVYRAVNITDHRVAACKLVTLTSQTTNAERKALDKEMRVHTALKHRNVLEFYNAYIVEPGKESPYYPGIYMLLELAAGGDLFDKIGKYCSR